MKTRCWDYLFNLHGIIFSFVLLCPGKLRGETMTSCSVWKERGKHAELTLLYFTTKIIILILRFSLKRKKPPTKKPQTYMGGEGRGDKFTKKVSKSDTNKRLFHRIIVSIFWTHNLSYILTRSFSFPSVAAHVTALIQRKFQTDRLPTAGWVPLPPTLDVKQVNGNPLASLLHQGWTPKGSVVSWEWNAAQHSPFKTARGGILAHCWGHPQQAAARPDGMVQVKCSTVIAVMSHGEKSMAGRVWIQHLTSVQCQQVVKQNLDHPTNGLTLQTRNGD